MKKYPMQKLSAFRLKSLIKKQEQILLIQL